MSQMTNLLAIDLGASSGRVMVGRIDGQTFVLEELHRFPNNPLEEQGHLHWDMQRLWSDIQTGMARYADQCAEPLAGIGIDSWAVDYALLGADGQLLGKPYAYRDRRTNGVPEWVDQQIAPERLYALTGIQRLPINTLYQLASMRYHHDPQLDAAETLLMIPDLFHYWMTGRKVAEYTNATTTQFFDASARQWSAEILAALALPQRILPPIVTPGTLLGALLPQVAAAVGLPPGVPVIASATHDTASAVAAVPGLDATSAYISSGTWSLVGVELPEPILHDAARLRNFTNEGGVAGTIRFLRNVGGLWLVQECQRQWQREGRDYSWPELVNLANGAEPLRSMVDPDAPEFLSPESMPAALANYCRRTNQPIPHDAGALVRCCLESLALKYRWVLEAIESLTGQRVQTIRIVGGGSQNALLCQCTADGCQRRVVAGPAEATALGNMLVQAVALGRLPDIAAGRAAAAASIQPVVYEPQPVADWDSAYARFNALLGMV